MLKTSIGTISVNNEAIPAFLPVHCLTCLMSSYAELYYVLAKFTPGVSDADHSDSAPAAFDATAESVSRVTNIHPEQDFLVAYSTSPGKYILFICITHLVSQSGRIF